MSEELENEAPQYVEVLWEDGSVIKCEIYDVIDFENKTYALLIPYGEEDNDDAEVIIMEYVEENEDSGYFKTIEDEAEFNRVCDYVQTEEAYLDEDEDEE